RCQRGPRRRRSRRRSFRCLESGLYRCARASLYHRGRLMNRMTDNPKYLAARGILARLRAAGHRAYFAGGCVRDLLLGVEPKDFDVATSATPDVVMGMFPKTYSVGAHFGVVLVCTPGGEREIATE